MGRERVHAFFIERAPATKSEHRIILLLSAASDPIGDLIAGLIYTGPIRERDLKSLISAVDERTLNHLVSTDEGICYKERKLIRMYLIGGTELRDLVYTKAERGGVVPMV